jgi:nucleoside-diphosphate-sugar epimerase
LFYSSSACIYPAHNQEDPENPCCVESTAYPANPDSEYGWEKLFSERLYLSYFRNYGLEVRIGRYHNIYGPCGTWRGGREKAPAAICRKVAEAEDGGTIEVWGDGLQTRSFLYIDECVRATIDFTRNPVFTGPVNIGSEEMVTINQLVYMAIKASGKTINIRHVSGPQGVRGRNSDNRLFLRELGWSPNYPLEDGIRKTYDWILNQIRNEKS